MKTHNEKRLLIGLLLLISGIVLLLKYYNLVPMPMPSYLFSWKTILILLGLVFIISEKNKTTGIILLVIGAAFLSTDIWSISLKEVIRLAIPLILIVIGLSVLMRRKSYSSGDGTQEQSGTAADYVNDVSIFGGGEKKVRTQNFRGGQLTAIFGGSDIDLQDSRLAEGVNGMDILCIFGGATLKVPEDWEVKNEVTAIFGGVSDNRPRSKNENPDQPQKVLYLKGLVIFGGAEVK